MRKLWRYPGSFGARVGEFLAFSSQIFGSLNRGLEQLLLLRVIDGTRAASIERLLTKKYVLTERDENLDRFCSKAFFSFRIFLDIGKFGHFDNFESGKFFWNLQFLISVF